MLQIMTNYLELLYLIAFIGVLAVAYSYLLSGQIISSSAGNSKNAGNSRSHTNWC